MTDEPALIPAGSTSGNEPNDIIYVGGTFDLFHHGHVRIFERAKEQAKTVVAAVNSDLFAESYKQFPIMREWERLSVVASCQYVDLAFIVENHDMQPHYIELFRPKYIAHGDDWDPVDLLPQLGINQKFLDDFKCQLYVFARTAGVSSRAIRARMEKLCL